MKLSFRLVALLLLLLPSSLAAQDGVRHLNDNARRSRPDLDPDLLGTQPKERLPLIQSSVPGISQETGWFLNRNTIAEGTTQPLPQNESSIAINPVWPNMLIVSAVDERGCVVYISLDGGRTWANKILAPVRKWRSGNDPSVGFDYLGNAYLMYGAFEQVNGRNGVYLSKSADSGKTWTRYVVIEHGDTVTRDTAFEDKYYIQIDNSASSPYRGRLYTPWKRVIDRDSSTQIMVARSLDGGAIWLPPVPVSPLHAGVSYDTTFGQSFPLTTTGPDGTLYVVWNDGPRRSIGFAKSADGGVTFSGTTYPVQNYPTLGTARKSGSYVYHVLKGTFRAETYPALTADNSNSPRKGWLYLVYAAGRNPDIFFMRSQDKGATWSLPRTIHSDTRGDQWWPWIMVDQSNGDLAVICSDSRDDSLNIAVNQYIAYSGDGGDTWTDRRATDVASDFRKNPYVDQIFAGDYSGGAFYNGKIYPSALDTRSGNDDVYTELVGVAQPYPVENLRCASLANNFLTAILSWKNPSQQISVFGKPYGNYTLVVSRDAAIIAALPPGTTNYADTGRTLDQQYVYTVRVAAAADTSVARTVKFRAGEARVPLAPKIAALHDYAPQVQIDVRVPTLRADSVTALDNLSAYRIYRNGVQVDNGTLNRSDTGKVVTVSDAPAERGYYRYAVSVVDGGVPANESGRSDTVIAYAGSLGPYAENFDGAQPRFLIPAGWGTTDSVAFSAPNSFTDSPAGDYGIRKNDYMQIYPVEMTGNVELTFAHIAIVDPSDTASVEISYDRGITWRRIITYNLNSDPAWSDRKANAGDWRLEKMVLAHPAPGPGTTGIVRFGLKTGLLNNADGWYLDDIAFGKPTDAKAGLGSQSDGASGPSVAVYPNPFSSAALISYELPTPQNVTLAVYNALGRRVAFLQQGVQESGLRSAIFRPTQYGLGNGIYFYELKTITGVARGQMIFLER